LTTGLLLDTHAFLWMAASVPRISQAARQRIEATARVCVSSISIVELCIKHGTGKLPLPPPLEARPGPAFLETIDKLGLLELPLDVMAAARLKDLPRHHDDPFDRLLIAQALEADLTLVTHDRILARYQGLDILWT
jgi:PIN domain nuclease of toxin-antitoxin system